MPSKLLTCASGSPYPIVSGNLWSGQGANHPVGGIQFYLDASSSGFAYVGYSGGFTVRSGTTELSGGVIAGLSDGFPLAPGGSIFLPKLGFTSGSVSVFATCDAACSGQARLWWQPL